MKKKVLSALLVASMTATLFAGCGDKTEGDKPADGKEPAGTESGTTPGTEGPVDYGEGTLTLWVAENAVDFTKEQVDAFLKENAPGYTATVEAVSEADAAGNMITDVEGGADLFSFAQDQLARLVAAGAAQPVIDTYSSWIAENNDEGSVAAVKSGDMTYAFPMTSDNGYFLFYDKSVVTNPDSLEDILADCEKAGKNFYMEINQGWYLPSFFFGTGCVGEYETDVDGNFTKCTMDFASDKGLVAFKEVIELAESKAFQNGSSSDDATNYAAIVTGTWNAASIKKEFGDNYACAKLPKFKGADDQEYQMSGFKGYKMLGIKPQTEEGKLALCFKLAQYLTDAERQVARYEKVGWGPSNLEAQGNEAVQADVALTALRDQFEFSIPQGQYPNDYWTYCTSFVDTIISGDISSKNSDDDLMKKLQEFQDTCMGYAK